MQALAVLMIFCVLSSYTVARSADTGFLNPSATGDLYNQWTNPSDAFTSNDQWASADVNNLQQDWFDFNFSVPGGATIDGIEINVEAQDFDWSGNGIGIEISGDAGSSYTTTGYGVAALNMGSDQTYTFGDATDTWGSSWSAAGFSNANFRVRLTKTGSDFTWVYVDHIQVKVYYTAAGACPATDNWPVNVIRLDCSGSGDQGTAGCSDYSIDLYEDLDYSVAPEAATADIQAVRTGFDSEYFYIEYDFVDDWNVSYSTGHQVALEFEVDADTESGRGDYLVNIYQKTEFSGPSWIDAYDLGDYDPYVDGNNDVGGGNVAASDFGGSQGDGYETSISKNNCDVLARVVNGNFQIAVRKSALGSPAGAFIRATSAQSSSLSPNTFFIHDQLSAASVDKFDNDSRFPILTYWIPVGITYSISGRVFEDAVVGATGQPFNGGEGDGGIANVRVELFDDTDTFQTYTTTDGSGNYTFNSLSGNKNYTVRVVGTSVNAGAGALGEQTFESDGASNYGGFGTAMGGQNPATADTTTQATLTGAEHRVSVAVATANVTGVDFGFSYELIVNTNNSGQGSLRQFIHNANLIAGTNASVFNIPNSDANFNTVVANAFTVQPTTALPVLTDNGTIIDGTTQETNTSDQRAGAPDIVLDGNSLGLDDNGLHLQAGNCTIRKMDIRRFNNGAGSGSGTGIFMDGTAGGGDSNTIAENYLTLNSPTGGAVGAISISGAADNNTIDNNTITANHSDGIHFNDSLGTGNDITNNTITGNGDDGVKLGGDDITFNGNTVDSAGVITCSVELDGTANSTIANNNITDSGTQGGVCLVGGPSTGNTIGPDNTITNNGGPGIYIVAAGSVDNQITQNIIYNNSGLGIDLNNDGISANDSFDGDSGPNDLLNFPVINSGSESGGSITVDFNLDVTAG